MLPYKYWSRQEGRVPLLPSICLILLLPFPFNPWQSNNGLGEAAAEVCQRKTIWAGLFLSLSLFTLQAAIVIATRGQHLLRKAGVVRSMGMICA